MDKSKFTKINRIIAIVVLAFSSFVYLATIEPTVSFWDCGEFIAASYKLEVGHAPGNPVFQLFAHMFTMFTSPEHAAAAVNCFSALCSAFTIFFLYLTIVHFGRRIIQARGRKMDLGNAIAVWGAGVVGALAYCFSDTFWFSAVEGEVYAMSSMLTAMVFWAILKWEEEADEAYANRWIILICFLTGLSIGVHLLNLLVIPAIAFVVYYKRHEGEKVSLWKSFLVLCLGGVFVALVLYGIVPLLPKLLAVTDRFFVNTLGCPFNIGTTVMMVIIFVACFLLLSKFRKQNKALAHTAVLGILTIIIGYSTFAIVLIRASAGTPTNEYAPSNPYTLIRYLSREQFGSAPIIYGQQYTSVIEAKEGTYYTQLGDRYIETDSPLQGKYPAGAKTIFPRMWSTQSPAHESFYDTYTGGKFKTGKVKMSNGEWKTNRMPYFKDNLRFFFDYQLNYMYFRYFFWNFVGRQNDFHGQVPGDVTNGNWESGIRFLDEMRLGTQDVAPDYFAHNESKNHYFFLPLLLGLIGLFFQLNKDGRGCWINFLLFFLLGIAIILYLNQPPYQVRERDYAYAGSFYVFTIWIGLAVMWLKDLLDKILKPSEEKSGKALVSAGVATALCLAVTVLMGCQNWDDHDRSNRYTARDIGYNYLNSCDENAIIITHGDNDTFPLWYAQEVESVRTDVRVMNTSLLGMDWYIDQMKCKMYESEPLDIDLPRLDYLYGTNDYVPVADVIQGPADARYVMDIFKDPKYRQGGNDGILVAKTIRIPVNKENVIKYKIVDEKHYDQILDYIDIRIEASAIDKSDLIILDLLSNYNWDRPIYYISSSGEGNLKNAKYLRDDGFAYKLVPMDCDALETAGSMDYDMMYDRFMNVYHLDSFGKDFHVDYQNLYTFLAVCPIRSHFVNTAEALMVAGQMDKAMEIVDLCVEKIPQKNFPYNASPLASINEYSMINLIELYLKGGQIDKAKDLADKFVDETVMFTKYYGQGWPSDSGMLNEDRVKANLQYIYYINSIFKNYGEEAFANEMMDRVRSM